MVQLDYYESPKYVLILRCKNKKNRIQEVRMKNRVIKIGYLVSYDWKLLSNSIPLVYHNADIIVLALDRNCRTWAGNNFEFNRQQFDFFVSSIDPEHKIQVYEDDFYDSTLSAMQNEVRERNMLAARLGEGGWHIQIDADEYPVNFSAFTNLLKSIDPDPHPATITRPINVCCNWVTLLKRVPEGFIYVKTNNRMHEQCKIATQKPNYMYGRGNDYFNLQSSMLLVHESMARPEEEIYFKLKNWGHNNDFDVETYFKRWKSLNTQNYQTFRNFHPIIKETWPELALAPAQTIPELISFFEKNREMIPPRWHLQLKNSRNLARLRQVASKFGF
jgi:hypothetical protein